MCVYVCARECSLKVMDAIRVHAPCIIYLRDADSAAAAMGGGEHLFRVLSAIEEKHALIGTSPFYFLMSMVIFAAVIRSIANLWCRCRSHERHGSV